MIVPTSQVSTNGLLSFGQPHTPTSSGGFNFSAIPSPPIIAPFWDDINVEIGGTIYYRQESDTFIVEQLQQAISSQYPEAKFLHPPLVFLATWDRVEPFNNVFRGLVNTFQVIIVSDGTQTFVRFNYGDIQWGGSSTLIGVSAGDQHNFITHPASLSSSVLMIDNTTVTYQTECKFFNLWLCLQFSCSHKTRSGVKELSPCSLV